MTESREAGPLAGAMDGHATSPPISEPALSPVLLTVVIGIAYYMAARLSLLLQIQPDNIAVFWPAAGISAGALIALGDRARLPVGAAVLIATVAANVEHGASLLAALLFGACNAGECLLAAAIITRLFGHPFQLDSLARVVGFIATTLAATAAAALPAAITLVYVVNVPVNIPTLWHVWLESDAVGIVTVAPLLIALPAAVSERQPLPRMLEGIGVLAALAATAVYVFSRLPEDASWPTIIPLGLLFPLLLWLAARCPPIYAAAGSFAIALAVVYCVTRGHGALGQAAQPLVERVFIAQVAMLTLSLCALALSALIASQRNIEAALRTSQQRLSIASSAAGLGVFEWRIEADMAVWENQRMYEIFGHAHADGPLSFTDFAGRYLDPADKPRVLEESARAISTGEVHTVCRFRRKDGEWRNLEIIGAVERDQNGKPARVVGVMADITERRRSEERQALLIGELDHRVKNALEGVATLIAPTQAGATGIEDFVDKFTGRIQSMARAHQLLSRERWSGVALGALVAEELEAYADPGRIVVEGPSIKLTTPATQAVSMVLHELATNAAKHGALSSPTGRVQVGWALGNGPAPADSEQLVITWTESGGPPVTKPERAGFGTRVIREPIVYELGGRVDLDFAPEGVRCLIILPLRRVLAG